MSRIRDAVVHRGEKAMGLFLTSGFPDPESTLPILLEIDRGGADFIELGMPFSDPLAEGLPIQRSSERALKHGVRLEDTLATARAFRESSDTPLLLMGYINPIFHFGVRRFCREASECGVDGLILPDLPPEESGIIRGEAAAAGLGMVHLIAPNTPDDRVRQIDELTTAFVYAVSITGLTGTGLGAAGSVETYLERARALVQQNPLLVGFGINTHDDAMRLSRHTDGFIVGSALIRAVEALWDDSSLDTGARLERVASFAKGLKRGDAAVETSP